MEPRPSRSQPTPEPELPWWADTHVADDGRGRIPLDVGGPRAEVRGGAGPYPAPPGATSPYAGVPGAEAGARRGRRRMVGSALAVVLLLAILGSLAFAFNRGRDGNDQRQAAQAAQTATRSSELSLVASAVARQTAAAAAAATPTATPPPASPTAAATPTTAPGATAAETLPTIPIKPTATKEKDTAKTTATGAASAKREGRATTIAAMLPKADEVPEGLKQSENATRSEEQTAQAFSDPVDAADRLAGWGWKGNVFRRFEAPADPEPNPQSTTFLEVSIHRFRSAEAASEALPYFTQEVAASRNLQEIEVEPLGDEAKAVAGGATGSNEVTLYMRRGPILYKVSGFSPEGDPTADVVGLAKTVLEK